MADTEGDIMADMEVDMMANMVATKVCFSLTMGAVKKKMGKSGQTDRLG